MKICSAFFALAHTLPGTGLLKAGTIPLQCHTSHVDTLVQLVTQLLGGSNTSGPKAPPSPSQPCLRFNRAEHIMPVPPTPLLLHVASFFPAGGGGHV